MMRSCWWNFLLLFFWSGEGATETALPSTTDGVRTVGGPNVCRSRYKNYCCPGWKVKSETNLCVQPVCWRHCGDGTCIKPNICLCANGVIGATCPSKITPSINESAPDGWKTGNSSACSFLCLNGGSCVNGKCVCKFGYAGDYCAEPVCKDICLNGGRCIGPDRCACVYGYAGKRCEADYRVGPCYRQVLNDTCQSQLEGVVCTKQLCCATVGRAWGHPCEHCSLQLECEPGFLKNIHSAQCLDIDECEAIPNLCDGGTCLNTDGSFQCSCPRGKVRNPLTNVCEDDNECRKLNLCHHGQCVNTHSSYYCVCDTGYIPSHDKKYCLDSRQSKCFTNVDEQKRCVEPLSMKLSRMDCCCGKNMGKGWGEDCEECPRLGTDDYATLCMGGSNDPNNNTLIMLVDECALRPGICGGGRCIDTATAFICDCYPGYANRKISDVQFCQDVDECGEGLCKGGRCTNTAGSYTCSCAAGFDVSSDGKQCIDRDECSENGMCANGICINMDGSFKCRCNAGYALSAAGHACVDVDECSENPRVCLNGRCLNAAGGYRCECQPGFTHTSDAAFCVDINECALNPGTCDNGRCINTEGSYRCICNVGFHLSSDKKSCIDFDECLHNICLNGKCINSVGSYRCECAHGFHLASDGRTCLDLTSDLCYTEYRERQCYQPSQLPTSKSSCCCSPTNQSMAWGTSCTPCPTLDTSEYRQLCPHGTGMTFTGDDINECAHNPHICDNGACENLMGTYRCICNRGYEPDSTAKICIDINECKNEEVVCQGGRCKNTAGNFQCICPTGTRFNPVSSSCDDIDECTEPGFDTCGHGSCVNNFGSYTCVCRPNSILDNTGTICLDNQKGSCWTKVTAGRCENNLPTLTLKSECCCSIGKAWGSSPCEICHHEECDCLKGFSKSDGKTCLDINECALNSYLCRGGGTCVNTEGSFACVCPPGLTLNSSGTLCQDTRSDICYTEYKYGRGGSPLDGLFSKTTCCCSAVGKAWGSAEEPGRAKYEACPRIGTTAFDDLCPKGLGFIDRKDINECAEFTGICLNGKCKNTIGGFTCTCKPGFFYNENGLQCIDINECKIMYGVCGDVGECENTPGSFECKCKDGYESHPITKVCTDVDECEKRPTLCRGGSCVNDIGSYHCECPEGHELSPDRQTCKDIDECSRSSGICSNGICENMLGTYQCICDVGYQQTDKKSHCEDIDECALNNGECEDLCINKPGSYSCECRPGLVLLPDGRSCIDIDECQENHRVCNGGECFNTIGSYFCECNFGLLPDSNNSSCTDINECEKADNICGNGECVNNIGSFTCRCEDGYNVKNEENPYCTDEDECLLDTDNCDTNSLCINNPGSYHCRCLDGFNGNGQTCHDINECLTNNGGCHKNALCMNTEGSFKCVCEEGFTGNGYICDDIEDCLQNSSLCENGHCINSLGSYKCECDGGFMNPDDRDQKLCIDINECELFPYLCMFGTCVNMVGRFRCECNTGYQTDNTGGNCTDINECNSPQACLHGNCTNSEGSFICQCPYNYQLSLSGNACVDRRESRCYLSVEEQGGKNRCSQDIGSPVTKATCCCTVGKAWGGRCEFCPLQGSEEFKHLCPEGSGYRPNITTGDLEDANECQEHENLCKNGHCTNTFGSYMCICDEGFKLDTNGAFCKDVDECTKSTDICGTGFCINDEGSYHCICPDGFMAMSNGKECVDTRKEECFMNYSLGMCSEPMSSAQTRMVCCCSMGHGWGQPCQLCPVPSSKDYTQLCGSHPGLVINPITNLTEEIDECTLMPQVCKHGICINTQGSFHCICDPGYVYDNFSHQCIDENECTNIPNPCQGNSQCINTPGRFECQCPKGYKLGLQMNNCIDMDECYEQEGICQNGDCVNLEGSFQCLCQNGYALNLARDTCIDMNECLKHPNICNNGTCENMDGAFKCHCYDGFRLSHNNDCIDVDECAMMPHLCHNGRCRNTIGSFYCECTKGYILTADGQHCKDFDECKEQVGSCPSPGHCQNTMGSYFCICPSGYKLSLNKTICEDINECNDQPNVCKGGKCININGGVVCECPEGYTLSNAGTECIDRRQDKCYLSYINGACTQPRNQQISIKECCCSNGIAWGHNCVKCPQLNSTDFAKLCPMGMGHGDQGEDLNECLLIPNVCQGGECINTDGSFRCDCPIGFVWDSSGMKCVDNNECITNYNICGNGSCTNLLGSFECTCNIGFAPGPSQACEDINECIDATHQCAFRCHNTHGSYRCSCPYGYSLAENGQHCQDVDECQTSANSCKYNCKNLIGSFICLCPDGYTQIGVTDDCRDINECLENTNVCENGHCVNFPGGYKCKCLTGYKPSMDGKKCLDERIGHCYHNLIDGQCKNYDNLGNLVSTRADCCCTMGKAWGPQCHSCPAFNTQEYKQLCYSVGLNIQGHDIDECNTMLDLCINGKCINSIGSYRCSCNKGYKSDRSGTKCLDINECHLSPSPCQMTCKNLNGGFECGCSQGYTLNWDNTTCHDIDECETGRHICQQKCLNTNGSYECSCNPGYKQMKDRCFDINECNQEGVCPFPGNCINTLGTYRCLCPRGYKLDPTNIYCTNTVQCSNGNCSKPSVPCKNGNNVKCSQQCPVGFTRHPIHNECIDINECLQSPCGSSQCINTMGSYQCVCPNGFTFDETLISCIQVETSTDDACLESICVFSCTVLGINNYVCGCPFGFQHISQGHCLSTANSFPGANTIPDLGENIPTFPISPNQDNSKIVSTEGCFSCKFNDKEVHSRQRRSYSNFTTSEESNGSLVGSFLEISLSYDQLESYILKLQPATKNKVNYVIDGNKDTQFFSFYNENSVWLLYINQKLEQKKTVFYISILNDLLNSSLQNSTNYFKIQVKIIIVP